jgi:hypothetical protein
MGKHVMDMTQETEPNKVFTEGWHDWEVVKVEEETSKAGNQMFKISLVLADKPAEGTVVYAVAEQGKRWFLKQLLIACDCPAGEDGVYDWSEEDVEDHTVSGRVENAKETWIDREGKTRETLKSKIVEFRKMSVQ